MIFWRFICVLYMCHIVAPDSIDCLPRYGAVFVNARAAVFRAGSQRLQKQQSAPDIAYYIRLILV